MTFLSTTNLETLPSTHSLREPLVFHQPSIINTILRYLLLSLAYISSSFFISSLQAPISTHLGLPPSFSHSQYLPGRNLSEYRFSTRSSGGALACEPARPLPHREARCSTFDETRHLSYLLLGSPQTLLSHCRVSSPRQIKALAYVRRDIVSRSTLNLS